MYTHDFAETESRMQKVDIETQEEIWSQISHCIQQRGIYSEFFFIVSSFLHQSPHYDLFCIFPPINPLKKLPRQKCCYNAALKNDIGQ